MQQNKQEVTIKSLPCKDRRKTQGHGSWTFFSPIKTEIYEIVPSEQLYDWLGRKVTLTLKNTLTYSACQIKKKKRSNILFQITYPCLFPRHTCFPMWHPKSPELLWNVNIYDQGVFQQWHCSFLQFQWACTNTLCPQLNLHSGSGCFPVPKVFLNLDDVNQNTDVNQINTANFRTSMVSR